MKKLNLSLAVALLTCAAHYSSHGIEFTDGFEGATIDPFWTLTQNGGSITHPSTAQVHSGAQSLQVTSVANSGNKNIGLSHQFATPVYGTVGLWVFDSGADLFSGNYLALVVGNAANANSAQVFANDFDLGVGRGGEYHFAVENSGSFIANAPGTVDRTQAWHQFQITSTPTELSLLVDGQTIYSGTEGFAFDRILFDMHGPEWRPGMTAYFDDFSFREYEPSSVPDTSSSAVLLLASLSGMLLFRRRFSAEGTR